MKRQLKALCIAAMLSLGTCLHAQVYFECGNTDSSPGGPRLTDCSETSADFLARYRHMESFVPRDSNTPIKYLHVNINIWQRADGTGNFKDTPSIRAQWQHVIDVWTNQHYQFPQPYSVSLSYPVETLTDSRIRIVLDSIYYYQDTTPDSMYYYAGYSGGAYGHAVDNEMYLAANYPERTRALNIHVTRIAGPYAKGYADYGLIETFVSPDAYNEDTVSYGFVSHFAHEMGHSFDLWHTYNGATAWQQNCKTSYADFLYDIYDTTVTNLCSPSCDVCYVGGENSLMGGQGEWHISALQMGIIHRSTVMENFRNNNYGVRDHMSGYSTVPFEITSNQTWDFSMKFYQNIVVKPGKTLTIKCKILMVPQAKIIVEPGGTLIIDGGIITNEHYHDDLWQGVEVWGNNAKNQFTPLGYYEQGRLIMMNGAVIENAHEGVIPFNPAISGSAGGIIQAENSTFRNNKRSAQFISYKNFKNGGNPANPADIRDNVSYFRNCIFETTQNLKQGNAFNAFITMWEVTGVTVTGCTFRNTNASAADHVALGKGIYSIDANYNVVPYCNVTPAPGMPCPAINTDNNIFINMNVGIEATKSTAVYTYLVRNNIFENNRTGIINTGISNPWLVENRFSLGNNSKSSGVTQIGLLYSGTLSGLKIENNFFFKSPITNSTYTVGSAGSSVGLANNTIYRNKYSLLRIGNQATGINKSSANDWTTTGLDFQCNTDSANIFDFVVTNYISGQGIKTYQGTTSKPAGNIFSNNGDIYESELYIHTPNAINYYYYGSTASHNPASFTAGTVSKFSVVPQNTCVATYEQGGGGQGLTGMQRATHLDAYTSANDEYQAFKTLITGMIDGGNTEGLRNDIAASEHSEAMQLRSTLLQHSPFLSEEVLRTASDKTDVLSSSILFEILQANPGSLKNKEFLDYLSTKSDPLPAWMIQLLDSVAGVRNYQTILSEGAAYYDAERTVAIDAIVSDILSDTSGIDHDSLRLWLSRYENAVADYQIVNSFVQTGQIQEATAFLGTIPATYKLSGEYLADYENIVSYHDFYVDVLSQGKSIADLDSAEVIELQSIADASEYTGSMRARNVLNFFYGYQYVVELPMIEEGQQKQAQQLTQPNAQQFSVFPNPASDWVILSGDLIADATRELVISDITGKAVYQTNLQGSIVHHVVDTRAWERGTYLYAVYERGKAVKTGKIIMK